MAEKYTLHATVRLKTMFPDETAAVIRFFMEDNNG